MQTETILANGKKTSLTPNCDLNIINPNAPKMSVEYAKARQAINDDFKILVRSNVALAKRLRRESKKTVVEFLKGTVSIKDEGGEKKYLVTFPDQSVARL